MFQVSSVMFASGHLTSLLTLGVNTGLVMDVGYTETLVVPVSLFLCLVHINFTAQSTLLGHIGLRQFSYWLKDG